MRQTNRRPPVSTAERLPEVEPATDTAPSGFWDGQGAPPVLDPSLVRPTVDAVAALERSRCQDADGNDQGTFTDTTWPSATDVSNLIDAASAEVLGQFPTNVDPAWYPALSHLIALRTAMGVEASFFRVQLTNSPRGNESYYAALTAYSAALAELQALIPKPTFIGGAGAPDTAE